MSQEMFLRKIPEDMRPWECNVNGVKYVYPAGTEQNVPAEVAALIDAYWEKQKVDYPETGTSFNDLRDRPFGESTEVLFDQRVEFVDMGNGMMVFDGEPPEPLETGKTYTVTYNGEKYNCVAFDASDDGTEVAIGNSVIFGMDTGEPFLIITGFDGGDIQEYFFSVLSLNGDTSATIRIEKSVIHTIDPKYLPETGAGFNVNVWYESGEYVSDKTYEEVKAAEEAKTPIVGTFTLHDGKVFTMIGCDSALPTVNLVAFNLNSTPDIGVYHVSIDANDYTNIAFFSIAATAGGVSDIYPK